MVGIRLEDMNQDEPEPELSRDQMLLLEYLKEELVNSGIKRKIDFVKANVATIIPMNRFAKAAQGLQDNGYLEAEKAQDGIFVWLTEKAFTAR